MLVQVARQVEDEARLAAVLDDDVQGLEAVVVLLAADGGESSEVAVVVEPLFDEDAVTGDGRRVLEANRGRHGQQLRMDAAAQEVGRLIELGRSSRVSGLVRVDDVEPEWQAALD
jgi:hypothetical protein